MRAARAAVAAAVALLLLVGGAGPAIAHDELVSTAPTDGAVLAGPPGQVVLTMSEPPRREFVTLRVTGPAGQVASGAPRLSGSVVTAAVRDVGAGPYRVLWRVVSDDGHPVAGSWSFSVGGAASSPVAAPVAAGGVSTTTSSAGSSRLVPALLLGAGALLAIVALFAAVAWRGATRRRDAG